MERLLALPIDGSAHGPQLDAMTALVHWLMLVLFVGWGAFFVYTLVRFRAGRNPRADYQGVRSHVSSWLEIAVALFEGFLLIGFAYPAWAKWVHVPAKEDNPLEIRVVGEQFSWNVHYPGKDGVFGRTDPKLVSTENGNPLGLDPKDPRGADDIVSVNQLHLPAGRPVVIYLSSKDVIHSFFLPYERVKQDAIPGQVVAIHFTPVMVTPPESKFPDCAAKKDCWEIACAQLCGLGHFRMRGYLTVESPADFQKWLDDQAPKPAAAGAPAG